jgi:dTMP kinase
VSAAAGRPGRFLVFEGIDGCGKTTQLEALRRWLPDSGLLTGGAAVVVTREPGGTALGRALREMLLHPPEGAVPAAITELLLYAADRAQHVQECILPALAAGDWVLCDRYSGSTAAYQGHGRGLPLDLIGQLETLATAGLVPDLTLWLELPLEQALRRRRGRAADRIEDGGAEFLARVCAGFARLAAERGWQRIDARAPLEQVTLACRERLLACLGPPGGADG